jgi:hypothetical protein
MRFAQETFGFTEADWTDAARLRAKVLGAVAHHRARLTAPEHSEATFAALHHALAGALATESVPDPEAVALGLLLQSLHQAGIALPDP